MQLITIYPKPFEKPKRTSFKKPKRTIYANMQTLSPKVMKKRMVWRIDRVYTDLEAKGSTASCHH